LILALIMLGADAGSAQTTGTPPPACEKSIADEEAAWGKSKHEFLDSVLHKEQIQLKETWCRIGEATGYDRVHKAEDFGRVLITGDGLHPAVSSSIVPGSGLAGGGEFALDTPLKEFPVRPQESIKALASTNGSWFAGGKISLVGSSPISNPFDQRHIHATLEVQHYDLSQLNFDGLGSSSSRANETVYALQTTSAGASLVVPVPRGFFVTTSLEGLWANPGGVPGESIASIGQIFSEGTAPALNTSTAYLAYGAGAIWEYPLAPRLFGYRSVVSTQFRMFHEASGAPFSFRRFDATWIQSYALPPLKSRRNFSLGTFSLISRLVESVAPAGNNIPFYLQPTLGGTDITNQAVLPSYADYRFRAPNAEVFQTEYERAIKDPLGLVLFYDVGKVALTRSDLAFDHMPHSFGVGIAVRVGNYPVLNLYYAWAGHEGTHTIITANTDYTALTAAEDDPRLLAGPLPPW
jgi:hypothetical protein